MSQSNTLDSAAARAFLAEAKVGLLATVSPEGLPHISLITSLRAKDERRLMFGQFTRGQSKEHLRRNPRAGWLVLTMDKRLWRGKALWTHVVDSGEDYVAYNETPMFRYNSYVGIQAVHYLDLVSCGGEEKPPLGRIGLAALLARLARGDKAAAPALIPWARNLMAHLASLKFIAWLDSDGFPNLVPLIQAHAPDSATVVFSPLAYGAELIRLRPGQPAAVFGLSMAMEDVLARGCFRGWGRSTGARLGRLDIDYVYNSMPPKQGQVYPRPSLEPVRQF